MMEGINEGVSYIKEWLVKSGNWEVHEGKII